MAGGCSDIGKQNMEKCTSIDLVRNHETYRDFMTPYARKLAVRNPQKSTTITLAKNQHKSGKLRDHNVENART